MFWVGRKGSQDFCDTFKENGIDDFLMPVGEVSQFIGQGERCQKIRYRHELCLLFIKPGAGLMVETLWTMAVTA